MQEHNARWIAGLSDGTTCEEGKGEYKSVAAEPSPWQRLLSETARSGRVITSLGLVGEGGRAWNLPSVGKSPKFKAFADAPKPAEYRMFRQLGRDAVRSDGAQAAQDLYTVIECRYPDGSRLQLWVDEATGVSWAMVPAERKD